MRTIHFEPLPKPRARYTQLFLGIFEDMLNCILELPEEYLGTLEFTQIIIPNVQSVNKQQWNDYDVPCLVETDMHKNAVHTKFGSSFERQQYMVLQMRSCHSHFSMCV